MSATAAQLTANRENSRLSTGPRTQEGLAASKLNAIKHGLTSSQAVIHGEDPDAYADLRAELIETWDPDNEIEAILVEQLALATWKLQRADRIEANLVNQLGGLEACFLDDKAIKKYNNFQRHRNTIERTWNRCYTELKRLAVIKAKQNMRSRMTRIGSVLSAPPATTPAPVSQRPNNPLTASITASGRS
jgi:hypothetical protein